jgi:hypothetical protein
MGFLLVYWYVLLTPCLVLIRRMSSFPSVVCNSTYVFSLSGQFFGNVLFRVQTNVVSLCSWETLIILLSPPQSRPIDCSRRSFESVSSVSCDLRSQETRSLILISKVSLPRVFFSRLPLSFLGYFGHLTVVWQGIEVVVVIWTDSVTFRVHTYTHTPIMNIYTHHFGKVGGKKTIVRSLL